MQRIFSTYRYVNQTLSPALLLGIVQAGFSGVEIFCSSSHFDYRAPQTVRDLSNDLQEQPLALHALHSPTERDMTPGRESGVPISISDPERTRRLGELQGWTWNPFEDQWEEGYRNLLAFAERQGTGEVPVAHVENGFPLGQWGAHQRTAHRRGKLDPVRTKRLEQVVGWRW